MFNLLKSFKTIDLFCFLILFKQMIYITLVASKIHMFRSNHPKVFCKKRYLRPATLFKKLQRRCFPVNFAKFLRTPFLTEHLRCGCFFMLLPPHRALTKEQHRSNKTVYKGLEKELVGQNIAGKTRNKFNIKLN